MTQFIDLIVFFSGLWALIVIIVTFKVWLACDRLKKIHILLRKISENQITGTHAIHTDIENLRR